MCYSLCSRSEAGPPGSGEGRGRGVVPWMRGRPRMLVGFSQASEVPPVTSCPDIVRHLSWNETCHKCGAQESPPE